MGEKDIEELIANIKSKVINTAYLIKQEKIEKAEEDYFKKVSEEAYKRIESKIFGKKRKYSALQLEKKAEYALSKGEFREASKQFINAAYENRNNKEKAAELTKRAYDSLKQGMEKWKDEDPAIFYLSLDEFVDSYSPECLDKRTKDAIEKDIVAEFAGKEPRVGFFWSIIDYIDNREKDVSSVLKEKIYAKLDEVMRKSRLSDIEEYYSLIKETMSPECRQRYDKIAAARLRELFNPDSADVPSILTGYYSLKKIEGNEDIKRDIADYIILNASEKVLREIHDVEGYTHKKMYHPEIVERATERLFLPENEWEVLKK